MSGQRGLLRLDLRKAWHSAGRGSGYGEKGEGKEYREKQAVWPSKQNKTKPSVREALGEKTGISLKCDQNRAFRSSFRATV